MEFHSTGSKKIVDEEKGEAGFNEADQDDSTKCATRSSAPQSPRPGSSSREASILEQEDVEKRSSIILATVSQGFRSLGRPWRQSMESQTQGDAVSDTKDQIESIIRQVHTAPLGYPRLATFLDSEDIFSMYRRFGYLQSRLLLEKQDDLRQLEADLDALDAQDKEECPMALQTRELAEDDEPSPQHVILRKIEKKFLEYSTLLQASQALMAFNKPTAREHTSVSQWLDNAQPLVQSEQEFIRCKEDLVTLRPGREYSWLDAAIEATIRKLPKKPVTWLFRSKETQRKSDSCHGEFYYTRSRIELCVNAIITFAILALLIIPIYILYHLTSTETSVTTSTSGNGGTTSIVPNNNGRINAICIGVMIISTLAFSASISLFTRARRHEILGASAAYCAVLVVFIGNVGGGGAY